MTSTTSWTISEEGESVASRLHSRAWRDLNQNRACGAEKRSKPRVSYTATLEQARKFNASRRWRRQGKIGLDPVLLKSPSVRKALDGMIERGATRLDAEDALMRAHNLGEILTVEELAGRLKVTPAWVKHRRRSRCKNKIPALDILGRPLRFDWDAVVKWLEGPAQAETKTTRGKRA